MEHVAASTHIATQLHNELDIRGSRLKLSMYSTRNVSFSLLLLSSFGTKCLKCDSPRLGKKKYFL
jgi:hypothetical protein